MTEPELSDVCLAVSSFRNDTDVLALLEALIAGGDHPFGRILIVDSLGTAALPRALASRAWPRVEYMCFDDNLGSAGNLAKRLELAARTPCRFVYAVNHDGSVKLDVVRQLRAVASADERIAAAYPLRRMSRRGGSYDVTGLLPFPIRSLRVRDKPRRSTLDVYWSSSNGALYSLLPVRQGLLPWADFWMGWEDLGYGWLLKKRGYRQVLVPGAVADDAYEYRLRGADPAGVWVTDKPAWYAYYFARNLVLATRRSDQSTTVRAAALSRILLEYAVTLLWRDDKRKRWSFVTGGLVDGLRGKTGKWHLP